MGMASTGLVRAEAPHVSSALGSDLILLQRLDTNIGQYVPYLITATNFLTSTPGGYTPGAVIFANASGDLFGDATNFSFNDSSFALAVGGAITGGGDLTINSGNIIANTAGKGLRIKSGSNARIGTATLAAGTVTVANTSVTASTMIFLTVQSLGTVTAPKAIAVTTVTANTSFVITSADNTDTSVVAWMLVESL